MHKKTRILSLAIINLLILSFITFSFAGELDPEAIVKNSPDLNGVEDLYAIGGTIIAIIQYIGVGVAIIATLILAMKYMYSSPDDKAEIKRKLMPFIIGGIMVFGAISLVKIVEGFVGEIL